MRREKCRNTSRFPGQHVENGSQPAGRQFTFVCGTGAWIRPQYNAGTSVATPGHTPGTLSYVFPVKDQGQTVTVAYSGGTLTGAFGTDGARWDEYIASQKKIARVAADAAATVMLSNHSEYDGAYTKARLAGLKREVEKGIRLSSALKAFSITSP